MGAAVAGVGVLPLFFQAQGGLQQGGEAVEGCVYGGFAQFVEMVLAEAEQQAAVATAVDASRLQGQGGGGVLFGAGGGGGEFGGEEVEMEGVRPGAVVVVVGEFLQGFVAPRQAAVFDCLAAVKLAGVGAVRAFDVAGEGVVSAMNAGQKPWLSRCWLRMSGEGRMKFWWRLAKFMGGSLGRLASGVQHFVGRVVRSWVRRLRKSRFSRLCIVD